MSSENIRHLSVTKPGRGRSVWPIETRILFDIALVLSIVLMTAALYFGTTFASALGRTTARLDAPGLETPGPVPTAQSTCINGGDPSTGVDC